MSDITKDEFERYEEVRSSGVTNMYAVGIVTQLSGLDRNTISKIMREYDELCAKYPGVRED